MSRQRGTAAIELVVGFTLIMIPMAMLVLSFAPLLEARSFVRIASSEMARVIATTDGDEVGAERWIARMAANNGFEPGAIDVVLCGGTESALGSGLTSSCLSDTGVLTRGQYVTVFMRVTVDVTPLFTGGFTASTGYEHAELVDLYRSIPQP